MLLLVALAILVPLSELAINLINRLVTAFVPPRPLPKLDYRGGIPESDRTIVVVPVLIGSADKVPDLLGAAGSAVPGQRGLARPFRRAQRLPRCRRRDGAV